MALTLTTPNTILGALEPKSQTSRLVSNLATVLLGTVLITLAAKVNVPTWPVPVTLQTFVVMLLPFCFSFWGATLGTGLFALLGGVSAGFGVAFFASVSGATWGYILGFLVAPAVARLFPRESRWVPVSMAAMLAVVYLMGVSWMAYWLGFSLYAALMLGVVPFLPADALKLAAASVLVILWDRCRKSLSGARAEEK